VSGDVVSGDAAGAGVGMGVYQLCGRTVCHASLSPAATTPPYPPSTAWMAPTSGVPCNFAGAPCSGVLHGHR